jgi:hypothetical protein
MSSDDKIQKFKRDMEMNLSATLTTVLISAAGFLIAVLVTLGIALQHDGEGGSPAATPYTAIQQERALFAVSLQLIEKRRKRLATHSPLMRRGSETASIQQQKLVDFDDFE